MLKINSFEYCSSAFSGLLAFSLKSFLASILVLLECIKSYLGMCYVGFGKFANGVQKSFIFLPYSQDILKAIP